MVGIRTISIPQSILDAIKMRAKGVNEEVCGAILRGEHIELKNVAPSFDRFRRYQLESSAQLELWKSWGYKGDLIIYHSHPFGSCHPSVIDRRAIGLSPRALFLIYSVAFDRFEIYQHSVGFPIRLEIDATEPQE